MNRRAFGETWSDTPDKMLMELGGRTFFSDTLGHKSEPVDQNNRPVSTEPTPPAGGN